MGNNRGFAREFTLEEIQKAVLLRDHCKFDWEEVARQTGPDVVVSSLKTTVSLHRSGKWRPTRRRTRGLRAELEWAVTEVGVTDCHTLCRFFDVTPDVLSYNLRQIGLDPEMRREIRRERDMRSLETGMRERMSS